MLKHANIALFVPHEGCPHRCIFCDQRTISGECARVTAEDVDRAVSVAVSSASYSPENTEIAFFGGSFTAIDREYMTSLLKAAHKYVSDGTVKGIRCSTRPDAIDDEVLEVYKSFGGTSIELGCQSMDDEVLSMNRRGHTAADTVKAAELIKTHGLSLGVQMMTGMYGDTPQGTLETAQKLITLEPDTARIYPTIVLNGTALGVLYGNGKYKAQSLDDAVEICSRLLMMFEDKGINVIKLGLHASDDVARSALAGPYHPAFRELCENRLYLEKAKTLLDGRPEGDYVLAVGTGDVSRMTGQKKRNTEILRSMGYRVKVTADEEMKKYQVRIVD